MAENRQLTQWNPFRELQNVQSMMDRFFEDWRPFDERFGGVNLGNALALDVHENDNEYTVTTELPGVKPENINIRQEGEYLLIEAEIPETVTEREGNGTRALIKERRYGRFSRRLRLPNDIDFNQSDATYEDGVLTLKLPKAEQKKPQIIPVKTKANN